MLIREIVDIIMKKAINSLNLNDVAYKVTSFHNYIDVSDNKVQKARKNLEMYSFNPKTSCITSNMVSPEVDVHIIVPVYNTEKFIRQCIDSVVNAEKRYTYRLTVINDGSTDGTAKILEEYKSNPDVEIITQENKGFSGARNRGLKHIVGRYISFLDSDDFVDWKGIEKMLDIAFANDYDIVQGSYAVVSENGLNEKRVIRYKNEEVDLANPRINGGPCAKVIKSQYFSNICFPEKYWFEDSIVNSILVPMIKSAYTVEDIVYYNRSRDGSISRTARSQKKSVDSFWITEQLMHDRERLGIDKNITYYEYILRMVMLTYERTKFQSKECKEAIFVLQADLLNKKFKGFSTKISLMKPLELAIRNNDYGYYKAFCQWK